MPAVEREGSVQHLAHGEGAQLQSGHEDYLNGSWGRLAELGETGGKLGGTGLERQIRSRLVERCRARQIRVRVYRASAQAYFKVQMRSGGGACAS